MQWIAGPFANALGGARLTEGCTNTAAANLAHPLLQFTLLAGIALRSLSVTRAALGVCGH